MDLIQKAEHRDVQPTAVEQRADRVDGDELCPRDVQRQRWTLHVGDDQVEDRREIVGETQPT